MFWKQLCTIITFPYELLYLRCHEVSRFCSSQKSLDYLWLNIDLASVTLKWVIWNHLFLRCPNDETVIYYAAPSVSAQRFSLEAFKFLANHPFVFVHCHVTVCNATDPDSLCSKTCSVSGRRKREVNDLMTDELYSLAQGPIHLARTKEEGKREKSLDKNGR